MTPFDAIFKELDRVYPGTNWNRVFWMIYIGAILKVIIEKL